MRFLTLAKRIFKYLPVFLLTGLLNWANADVLVLIPGYMGSPDSWEKTGINNLLEDHGWQRGGLIIPDTREYFPDPVHRLSSDRAENISYVIDMPWMRPLDEQAVYLDVAMQRVFKMRPDENITLIGHSAGALAARLWLVQYYKPSVIRLVSIAAPNLGTTRAIDALELTDPIFAPIDAVRNMFGGKLYNTVRRSRDLVYDFTPPSRHNPNVLYWLNQQAHPDIEYVSVVREDRRGYDKDWLVSADSQDLNNVRALRGKSKTYIVSQNHPLSREDGHLLVTILTERTP
jgi:triacylglycerol lipase